MKKYNKIAISFLSILFLASCSSDFLDYEPTGVLTAESVATAANADALVTAAYAAIGNDEMINSIFDLVPACNHEKLSFEYFYIINRMKHKF